jgi:hypothetical protein
VRGDGLMRVLFWLYLLMIAAGLAAAFVLGALGL